MQIGFGLCNLICPAPMLHCLTSPLGSPFCLPAACCMLLVASCKLHIAHCQLLLAKKKKICVKGSGQKSGAANLSAFSVVSWCLKPSDAWALNKCSKLYGDKCQKIGPGLRSPEMAGNREEDDILAWVEDQCVWGFLEGFKSVLNMRISRQECHKRNYGISSASKTIS